MKGKKVLAIGNASQLGECGMRKLPQGVSWTFAHEVSADLFPLDADAVFILDEVAVKHFPYHLLDSGNLVFINDVTGSLAAYGTPSSIVRMNGWPGFTGGPLLELSGKEKVREKADAFLDELSWAREWVPDIPGLLRPRVLAMIINEACFALAEAVSSREEIDTAMKLGTNYPFGPFEWAARIGPERIHNLLEVLSRDDERYKPAPGMLQLLQQTT
ncbi:MAG: 3-hydroxyacyl-CoA dehydrogenase family protein [Chitinophagaceae bacterium]|jgi:3-hydroxybutyryl-CoA dehydrogenase|nr:3-hydroxyacyl-CoA dehydrogenase family protein [Chitinophagaceae bacterium]